MALASLVLKVFQSIAFVEYSATLIRWSNMNGMEQGFSLFRRFESPCVDTISMFVQEDLPEDIDSIRNFLDSVKQRPVEFEMVQFAGFI